MKYFKIEGEISVYTTDYVKAESKEEAVKKAEKRKNKFFKDVHIEEISKDIYMKDGIIIKS